MTPLKNWPPILGLPDTLEKLLNETEINNSFRENAVTDTLKDTMESSYAYLYRLQRDSVNYSRFHYQTREYLLNTTYNNIQKGLKEYREKLKELESMENPDLEEISRIKEIISEFGEVRFGDLYLDSKRNVCVDINYDIIRFEIREAFRTSNLYKKNIPLNIIISNKTLFKDIPIAIIDGEVRMDISVYPLEQGTKIIFNHMTAKDVYNKQESQIFHDICILMIPNTNIRYTFMNKSDILNGIIPYEYKDENKKGIYFISIKGDIHSTNLIYAEKVNTSLVVSLDKKSTDIINKSTSKVLEVSIIFFQDLYKYDFTVSNDGAIPCKKRIYQSDNSYEEKIESCLFIPTINGSVLPMPIPEKNILIMKSVYEGTIIDRYEPAYGCGVNFYYPNIYQIIDDDRSPIDKYRVFFFYNEYNDIKYTPLFDFYWNYLRSRFNNKLTLEEVINKIYFKESGYNINESISENEENPDILKMRVLENEYLEAFYLLFEKMLEYKDYKYKYSTPDFISEYQGDEIPLQYKIAKMMEFIKADWKVLPEYVKKQRRKETLFHFFTNTINIKGRFRRSTRLEDKENSYFVFAKSAKITTVDNPNGFLVTDKKDYDINSEVFIDDVKIILPNVAVGNYIEFTDLTNRYVFAFKNPGKNLLSMKIFIDGILCTDVIFINSLGMDYLYLPVNMISENSYIMMELEWDTDDPQIEHVEFLNNNEWKTIHLIEKKHIEYTMNDIVLKVDGEILDETEYTINLVRNKIPYSMQDKRHGITNKYGIVTDINIQLTNIKYSFPLIVDVQIAKTSFISSGVAHRNGYPRFSLTTPSFNPDISYARMYYNGRLAPTNTFRLVDSNGRSYIQSRIFCEKGDQYLFEMSPYAKEIICTMDEFDPNEIFDFSKYADKPLDPEYYEVYVNGRRLGLPNVFPFGPNKAVFRGIKSKYLLNIFEKERDFEYFGYSKILKDNETYYYLISDFIDESFITENEVNIIIDEYINFIKHKSVVIDSNNPTEDKIIYDIEDGLLEEMKIFFFEELLPLGIGNPDEVQFNKAYFSEVFPSFTKEFIIESTNDSDIIFLNPDVTARIYDDTINDYEIIDTKDADIDKAFVMVTGESK